MTQPDHPVDPGPTLAAAVRAVARSVDLDETLDTLLALAVADRGAAVGMVAAVGDDGLVRPLRTKGTFGDQAGAAEGEAAAEPPTGDPLTTAILERRLVVAATADGTPPGRFAARNGLARLLVLPLVVGEAGVERAIGVLALGWRPGETWSDGTPGILDAAADLAALAVERAAATASTVEQADWQDRLAHLDALTGLANRRTLDRVLELEIERAKRQPGDIAVAVFDVDGFQSLNDRQGAAIGDAILRAVAATLAEQVRLVDTVARIGGDEFVVVAPGSGGVVVADRILRAIESLEPVAGVAVTVSAGIARFPADGTSADELLAAALVALDAARSSGGGAIAEVRPS